MQIKRIHIERVVLATIVLVVLGYSYGWINFDFKDKKEIVLQPYDDFPDSLVTVVEKGIKAKYNFDVTIYPPIKMSKKNAFKGKKGAGSYDSDLIIEDLDLPLGAFKIVGLTNKSITSADNIARKETLVGHAALYRNWCVVSTYSLLYSRGAKQMKLSLTNSVNHEIGHMLGLFHCDRGLDCLMDTGGRLAFEGDTGRFCINCKEKISEYLLVK